MLLVTSEHFLTKARFKIKSYKRLSETMGYTPSYVICISSMLNGIAEKAIKVTKRLLMENIGLNSELNNDKMV